MDADTRSSRLETTGFPLVDRSVARCFPHFVLSAAQNGRHRQKRPRHTAALWTLPSQSVRFRVKRIGLHPFRCSSLRNGTRKGEKKRPRPPRQPFVGNGVASLHTASLCQQEAHPGRPQAVPSATKELRVVAAAAHSMN